MITEECLPKLSLLITSTAKECLGSVLVPPLIVLCLAPLLLQSLLLVSFSLSYDAILLPIEG